MIETPPSPRWQRRPDARPDEILDAALEVFGAQGFRRCAPGGHRARRRRQQGNAVPLLRFEGRDVPRDDSRAHRERARGERARAAARRGIDPRRKLELLMRRIWAVVGDPAMARIIKLVHGELNNFPELARFYYEEVILRVRALGLERAGAGCRGRRGARRSRRSSPRAPCRPCWSWAARCCTSSPPSTLPHSPPRPSCPAPSTSCSTGCCRATAERRR